MCKTCMEEQGGNCWYGVDQNDYVGLRDPEHACSLFHYPKTLYALGVYIYVDPHANRHSLRPRYQLSGQPHTGANMFSRLILALALCLSLGSAAPFPHDASAIARTYSPSVLPRATNTSSCPGYKASNVKTTDSTLTADLILAGDACNLYSDDIKDLKLLVEYQTSKREPLPYTLLRLTRFRRPTARQDL